MTIMTVITAALVLNMLLIAVSSFIIPLSKLTSSSSSLSLPPTELCMIRQSPSLLFLSNSAVSRSVITRKKRSSTDVAATGSATDTDTDTDSDGRKVTNTLTNTISDVGVVILAGGTGSRMKASLPKQFLLLDHKPILHHSIELFLQQPFAPKSSSSSYFHHVVLVLDPMYQSEYQPMVDKYNGRLSFANPGKERQGSVENGLNQLIKVSQIHQQAKTHNDRNDTPRKCTYVAIHDSARPLVTIAEVMDVIHDAKHSGTAAVLSVPCKATIKESSDNGQSVLRTIPRDRLYEVHTPQVIRIDLLQYGFEQVTKNSWSVTDDVSIIEQLNEKVTLTRGEYTNIKITTPEDMEVAEAILRERKVRTRIEYRRRTITNVVGLFNTIWTLLIRLPVKHILCRQPHTYRYFEDQHKLGTTPLPGICILTTQLEGSNKAAMDHGNK